MSLRRQAVACYRRHMSSALCSIGKRQNACCIQIAGLLCPLIGINLVCAIQAHSCRGKAPGSGVAPTSSVEGLLVTACICKT